MLKLKSQIVFILLIVIPVVFSIVITVNYMINFNGKVFLLSFLLLMLYAYLMFMSWFYFIGKGLYQKINFDSGLNYTYFKACICNSGLYLIFMSYSLWFNLNRNSDAGIFDGLNFNTVLPFHFLAMFFIFYCIYFIAKALKSVEVMKPITFSEWVPDFFMIWLFPIGIWNIQPRINKIFMN